MKAYKGFDKNMQCRGFQYEEGKVYETDEAKLCESGFHACERPLDVLAYYPPGDSVYHVVELDEVSDEVSNERRDDSKVCGKKIKIGAAIDIAGLVKATVDYTFEKSDKSKRKHTTVDYGAASATVDYGAASATGYYGAASATGNCGAASATGYYGAASATGNRGAASATGNFGAASATGYCGAALATVDYGAASATGNCGAASATGYCGAASATGNCGAALATVDYGAASATGYCGAASATGYRGAASATGNFGAASAGHETAIAVAWGREGKARGVLGSHIVCAEWREIDGILKLVCAKMARVDGETIKGNVYYRLENGEFVEA